MKNLFKSLTGKKTNSCCNIEIKEIQAENVCCENKEDCCKQNQPDCCEEKNTSKCCG